MGFISANLQHLFEGPLEVTADSGLDVHIHVQDEVTIMNYMNAVPPSAEIWLDRLYGNVFSSLAHFRIYDGIAGVHTYIACRDEQVLAVLLYRTDGAQVRILNEASSLPAAEVERFAQHIFHSCPHISVISLHAVSLEGKTKHFPVQRFNCLEDIVLRLPAGMGEYTAHLGKSTRSYLNRYQNKLKRSFPSMRHATYIRDEIEESHIREILELNRSRMEGKGRVTPWTDAHRRHMLEMAHVCGMVHVITIDGRICAGTLNYCVNGNYFLEVIAHAPEYNDYGLGTLCCFATIGECIARAGKEYHFLWGQSAYKYRLGGVQKDLEHVSIFRSRRHMLLNPALVAGNLYRGYDRRLRLRVKEFRNRKSLPFKPFEGMFHLMQNLRLAWKRQRHQWLQSAEKNSVSAARSDTLT